MSCIYNRKDLEATSWNQLRKLAKRHNIKVTAKVKVIGLLAKVQDEEVDAVSVSPLPGHRIRSDNDKLVRAEDKAGKELEDKDPSSIEDSVAERVLEPATQALDISQRHIDSTGTPGVDYNGTSHNSPDADLTPRRSSTPFELQETDMSTSMQPVAGPSQPRQSQCTNGVQSQSSNQYSSPDEPPAAQRRTSAVTRELLEEHEKLPGCKEDVRHTIQEFDQSLQRRGMEPLDHHRKKEMEDFLTELWFRPIRDAQEREQRRRREEEEPDQLDVYLREHEVGVPRPGSPMFSSPPASGSQTQDDYAEERRDSESELSSQPASAPGGVGGELVLDYPSSSPAPSLSAPQTKDNDEVHEQHQDSESDGYRPSAVPLDTKGKRRRGDDDSSYKLEEHSVLRLPPYKQRKLTYGERATQSM